MSIRHHFSKFDRIAWLRSIGCVFYAPLDYENGLADIISGTTFTTSGGGQEVLQHLTQIKTHIDSKEEAAGGRQDIGII